MRKLNERRVCSKGRFERNKRRRCTKVDFQLYMLKDDLIFPLTFMAVFPSCNSASDGRLALLLSL